MQHTLLLVDLRLDVQVHHGDDHIGRNVQSADNVEDIWVLKIDLLGDLHHPEDDDQVGTVWHAVSILSHSAFGKFPFALHLRIDSHCDDYYRCTR